MESKEERELIKLYDLPRNVKIDVEHLGMKDTETEEVIKELDFGHIDGMYSLCWYKGKPVHLKAWTEVYINKSPIK